mgnify:FL=1
MAAILIVEDDLTFATMLKTWLGKQGFQISTAGDLSKAHKFLEHQSYDLILSDLRLPEGDGLSLLDWMQKHGLVVPLIVMTSYADVQNAVNAMKQGACDYIAKPVQPAMLLEKIEQSSDIKKLKAEDYPVLAQEIRQFLLEKISRTGGHLASNLGVVELTMALHLAFDLPKDKIIWDCLLFTSDAADD